MGLRHCQSYYKVDGKTIGLSGHKHNQRLVNFDWLVGEIGLLLVCDWAGGSLRRVAPLVGRRWTLKSRWK